MFEWCEIPDVEFRMQSNKLAGVAIPGFARALSGIPASTIDYSKIQCRVGPAVRTRRFEVA